MLPWILLIVILIIIFSPTAVNYFNRIQSIATSEKHRITSPAYGTVAEVVPGRITIFLGPNDIHTQYTPTHGHVHHLAYDRTGKFHLAFALNKSSKNEKFITILHTDRGIIKITQVAGYLTRRVQNYLQVGQRVSGRQPMGRILLGSRVDIEWNFAAVPLVVVGDRVDPSVQILA